MKKYIPLITGICSIELAFFAGIYNPHHAIISIIMMAIAGIGIGWISHER